MLNFRMIVTFDSNVLLTQFFFLIPSIFSRSIRKNHSLRLNFASIFSSHFYSYKNERNAFSEKSARSNRLTTFRTRRYRKNTLVQKRNRLKRAPEARVMAVWISFLFSHLISTHLRMSKTRFLKNPLAQTALRQFVCVGIEKIRRFKKKIARNGLPKPELWPFEVSQIPGYLQSFRIFSNDRNFRLERPFDAIFFLIPLIFARSIWETHPLSLNFLFTFFIVFQWVKGVLWKNGSLKPLYEGLVA